MEENHKLNCLHKIVHVCFAVFELDCDRIIGWCGLGTGHPESMDKNRIEIFYLLDKNYRRKGYATECATKLLEYGFLEMQVDRIVGGCAKENIGSQRVLEKIGMKNKIIRADGSPHYSLNLIEYNTVMSGNSLKISALRADHSE